MNSSFSQDLKKTHVTLGRGAPGQTGPMEQPGPQGTKETIEILDLRDHKVQRVLQEMMVGYGRLERSTMYVYFVHNCLHRS